MSISPFPIGGDIGSGMYIVSRCGSATRTVAPQSFPGNCKLWFVDSSSKSPVGPQPPCRLFDTIEFLKVTCRGDREGALFSSASPELESTVLLMKSASSPKNALPLEALFRTNKEFAKNECNGLMLISAIAPPFPPALLSAKTPRETFKLLDFAKIELVPLV